MRARTSLLATACLIAGCGATVSPHYGEHPDASHASSDATVSIDVQPAFPDVATAPDGGVTVDVVAPHGPPYPIVLHHGFAGFRQIASLGYFYSVAQDLRARGETVFESEVSPFDSPQHRAVQLASYVDMVLASTHSAKVVIVAHSEGGLDAREMISTLHYGDRVALLITVATPHRGTYMADAVLSAAPGFSDALLNAFASVFGYAYNDVRTQADLRAALEGMSEASADAFNRRNPDDARVVYWSWAGRSNRRLGIEQCTGGRFANDPTHVDDPNALLAPFTAFLEQGDPLRHVNDGMVEVQSARWGTFMGCTPTDHFDEVGQIAQTGPEPSSGFDHIAFYRTMVDLVHAAHF